MTKNHKIIAFAGRKRSGKTALANLMANKEKGIVLTVAFYLKKLCCELLEMTMEELLTKKDDGTTFSIVPDERWFSILHNTTGITFEEIRETLKDITFIDIRQVVQVIGTDLIRKYNPNWHVDQLRKDIELQEDGKLITIDDVRFPNEKKLIEELGGEVYFIVRPNKCDEVSNHVSETSLKWMDFDDEYVIINDTYSIKETYTRVFENKSALLSNQQQYLTHGKFPYNMEDGEDKEQLIEALMMQLRNNPRFLRSGSILLKTSDKHIAQLFYDNIGHDGYMKPPSQISGGYVNFMFSTYNPLITENIKQYLV